MPAADMGQTPAAATAVEAELSAFAPEALASSEATVFVNGERHVLPAGSAETTLLEYLREDLGLKGTKLGCGEGGCGACTVMVSHFDRQQQKIIHRAINACLAPLLSVEGMAVVTVEGIGSKRGGLHPVQQRLATAHGSQCGFCTPGFVMSMYSLLRSKCPSPDSAAVKPSSDLLPTEEEIEEALAGNLCRCTGYRPILDAFRVFAKTDAAAYAKEALGAAKEGAAKQNGTNGIRHGGKNEAVDGQGAGSAKAFICPSTGLPCSCGNASGKKTSEVKSDAANGHSHVEHGGGKGSTDVNGDGQGILSFPTASASEPIFPPALKKREPAPLFYSGQRGSSWYRPITMQQLLALKTKFPEAKLVTGNTEVGIEMKFKNLRYPTLIGTTAVPELNLIQETAGGLSLGAAVPLSLVLEAMKRAVATRAAHETSACAAIIRQLKWFAGVQIRNVACLGGNVCTGSPISDLNPLWMACRAEFKIAAAGGKERHVAARDFFLGYRKVDLRPEEVLVSVFLPWTRPQEFVLEFKQSHRKDDDIAIVNAGMRVLLKPPSSPTPSPCPPTATATTPAATSAPAADTPLPPSAPWEVEDIEIAYGGVAAKPVSANQVAAFLKGKPWTNESISAALAVLRDDVDIPINVPGGMSQFRRSLASSFLFKFFLHTSFLLESEDKNFSSGLPDSYRSAVAPYHRPHSRGLQFSESGSEESVKINGVGASPIHMAAELQVTGEAQYADDIPLPADGLHGALVLSSKPHALITSVNIDAAKSCPGFVAFFSHQDVPGSNDIGVVTVDEEVFASKKVTCVGQVIGIVVATTQANAAAAALKVAVEYEELPAILTIEEAIQEGSFFNFPFTSSEVRRMEKGNVEATFASQECEHVVEGEVRMGAQEQFYLEPNSCLVWTADGGNEVHMICSTQAPTHHQQEVAHILGIPLHRVVSRVKRIGGGFGGKESRSVIIAAAASVAAWRLKRPVRVTIDRNVDMAITGQRHPFLGKYKVGFSSSGKILALDLKIYNNAGNSVDLSFSVLERSMFHSDNVYAIPSVRIEGRMAKTNLPSNTAFRGFGGPQGMLVAEGWMDHVARTLKKNPEEIKLLNLHPEGHELHYGQKVERCQIQRIWTELMASSEFERRRAEAQQFNSKNRWRKRGIAMLPTKFGISFTTKFLNQGAALVHVYTDGTVLVTHGGVEMGQGLHTKVAQVVASAFGIPLSSIFISETATDKIPNTSPTAASASSDLYGMAALNACDELKKRMAPVREKMPNASFAQLADCCYKERINLSAQGFYATPEINFDWSVHPARGSPFSYHTYGAAVAEVEIDTLTGDLILPRVDILMDLGRSINPAIDIGQIEGAFVQGFGWSVLEEMKWGDDAHPWVRKGCLFTQGPGAYKIPAVNDIPVDFRVALLTDAPNPRAVASSKAVGEPPLFLGAAALLAIKDAIYAARRDAGHGDGFFVLDSPATPERIRMACADEFSEPFADASLRPLLSV